MERRRRASCHASGGAACAGARSLCRQPGPAGRYRGDRSGHVRAGVRIDSFRADSSLRTWLFTIERRLILDRRRAERRRKEDGTIDDADAATEFDALDEIVAEEAEARVRSAVERLSRLQREVFLLRVNEGLSYKEIAEVVGSTEGAARVHYHNAMRAVKELLYV